MKRLIFIILVSSLFIASCTHEESPCGETGKVIGYDLTLCVCCGGWIVEHDGDTMRFFTVPNEQELLDYIDVNDFPVTISFDYENIEGDCSHFNVWSMTCMEIMD